MCVSRSRTVTRSLPYFANSGNELRDRIGQPDPALLHQHHHRRRRRDDLRQRRQVEDRVERHRLARRLEARDRRTPCATRPSSPRPTTTTAPGSLRAAIASLTTVSSRARRERSKPRSRASYAELRHDGPVRWSWSANGAARPHRPPCDRDARARTRDRVCGGPRSQLDVGISGRIILAGFDVSARHDEPRAALEPTSVASAANANADRRGHPCRGRAALLAVAAIVWWIAARPRRPHAFILSPSTRCAPIGCRSTATRAGHTPSPRRLRERRGGVRARLRARAADAAVTRVDVHRHAAIRARRPRQPRVHACRRQGDARVDLQSRRATPTAGFVSSYVLRADTGIGRASTFDVALPAASGDKSPGADPSHRRADARRREELARRPDQRQVLPVLPHLRTAHAVPRRRHGFAQADTVRRRGRLCRRDRRPAFAHLQRPRLVRRGDDRRHSPITAKG